MNKDREAMNNALKEHVIPILREKKFEGSLPHFRRITDHQIDLLTFQFDQYGGGFVIEVSKAPNEPFQTYWGETIQPNKLTAYDLNPTNRKRIHPKGILDKDSTDDWFRYDKFTFFKKNIFKKIAKQVIKNLDLAEKYWDSKDLKC